MKKNISLRVIRRISFYYEALLKLDIPDYAFISSGQIEKITGISSNQVRQDLFYLGLSIGKQKKGYRKKELLNELKKILNIEQGADLIVIGAGKLGRALANYKLFRARNIFVRAFFDVKEELIGKTILIKDNEIPIFHIDDIVKFVKNNREIKVALLTVPEENAQETFEKVVESGIKGIVNYTPRILRIPEETKDIELVNDCLGISLYKVIYQLF